MRTWISKIVIFAAILGLTGCFAPEDKMAKDMKSKDVNVRRETAEKLGEAGTPRALQILQLHEDDPDYVVREKVRGAIKKIQKQNFFK